MRVTLPIRTALSDQTCTEMPALDVNTSTTAESAKSAAMLTDPTDIHRLTDNLITLDTMSAMEEVLNTMNGLRRAQEDVQAPTTSPSHRPVVEAITTLEIIITIIITPARDVESITSVLTTMETMAAPSLLSPKHVGGSEVVSTQVVQRQGARYGLECGQTYISATQ